MEADDAATAAVDDGSAAMGAAAIASDEGMAAAASSIAPSGRATSRSLAALFAAALAVATTRAVCALTMAARSAPALIFSCSCKISRSSMGCAERITYGSVLTAGAFPDHSSGMGCGRTRF